MSHFMKKPCEHCPYRNDVRPFLNPSRGEELAFHAQNPYNSFSCHKTTEADEESEEGEMLVTEKSKECAGFMTLQCQHGMKAPKGFEPSWEIVYIDSYEMADAYDNPEEYFGE